MWCLPLTTWVLMLGTLLVAFYKWSTSTFDFFAAKGVPFEKPIPFFGNFFPTMTGRRSFHETVLYMYNAFDGKKFFGMFQFRLPFLVIRDPDLLRQMMVKEFDHFSNHVEFLFNEEVDPLFGKSLAMMKDERWRDMRATLSPAFTGRKMRQMFKLVATCAEEATQMLLIEADKKRNEDGDKAFVPELKDVFTRCTNDVIATAAFGIQVNSLKDRDNKFYKLGSKSVKLSGLKLFKAFLLNKIPRIAKFLQLSFFDRELNDFFKTIVLGTMDERAAHGIVRPDMIQLLMESRKGTHHAEEDTTSNDGFATVNESTENSQKGNAKRVWSDEEYTSQCFLFFLAGFETSATLMCVSAHELTEHRDIQMRLITEIDKVRAELQGRPLTYEILQKMPYMDMVISESLRIWPPGVATDRVCTKRYELHDESTGQTVVIEKGDGVWIPIHGFHRDPKYFPNPEKFDPERFSVENRGQIQPYTYMPFGVGPRNCIASRFALMEAKAFLFYLLSSFTFEVAATTQIPLRLVKTGFGVGAEKGYNVHLRPRSYDDEI